MRPTARPRNLLGEGRSVGVFVVFNGGRAVLAVTTEENKHRDEGVLALRLNGETIFRIFSDNPSVVETCVGTCVARDFHLKALPQRRDCGYNIGVCAIELRDGRPGRGLRPER